MKVKLISYTPEPDAVCMRMATLCRDSAPSMSILADVVDINHVSILEHASFSFEVSEVSRSLTHQLIRHRIGMSYAQQSQRHVSLDGLDWYVVPPTIANNKEAIAVFHAMMENDRQGYAELLRLGIPKEDARFVLPNSAHTKIGITGNGNSLRHFFSLRCCKRSQWEIQNLANEMLRQVKLVAPIIFKSAGRQCTTCKEPCTFRRTEGC